MSKNLHGVYVVTGGGGAIGRSVLETFADAGAKLVVVDRALEAAQAAGDGYGAMSLAADLTSRAGAEELVQKTLTRHGRIDGLIHTVGGFAMGRIEEYEEAMYEKMFALNVKSLLCAARAVLPTMREQGAGFIAGFGSEPAVTGRAPGSALYGASKSAVANLLHSLDAEVHKDGIRVCCLHPMGAVDTPANRAAMPDFDPAHYIDPADLAEALLFAATRSPRARIPDLAVYPR